MPNGLASPVVCGPRSGARSGSAESEVGSVPVGTHREHGISAGVGGSRCTMGAPLLPPTLTGSKGAPRTQTRPRPRRRRDFVLAWIGAGLALSCSLCIRVSPRHRAPVDFDSGGGATRTRDLRVCQPDELPNCSTPRRTRIRAVRGLGRSRGIVPFPAGLRAIGSAIVGACDGGVRSTPGYKNSNETSDWRQGGRRRIRGRGAPQSMTGLAVRAASGGGSSAGPGVPGVCSTP